MVMKTYKPGEKAPASAQYEIVGKRGGHTGVERTVTKGSRCRHRPSAGNRTASRTARRTRAGGRNALPAASHRETDGEQMAAAGGQARRAGAAL